MRWGPRPLTSSPLVTEGTRHAAVARRTGQTRGHDAHRRGRGAPARSLHGRSRRRPSLRRTVVVSRGSPDRDGGTPRLSVMAAAILSALAALHACWGLGSAWPARDRARLAQLSSGQDEMPPAAACFAVATLLAAAAAVVLCRPTSRLRRAARAGVLAAFTARGLSGRHGHHDGPRAVVAVRGVHAPGPPLVRPDVPRHRGARSRRLGSGGRRGPEDLGEVVRVHGGDADREDPAHRPTGASRGPTAEVRAGPRWCAQQPPPLSPPGTTDAPDE
jgi:hypothetical protein